MSIEPCVNCGEPMTGRYCAVCGEKRPDPHDLTWKHLCVHAFEAFTHADGKVFLTLRRLIASPGVLTADFLRGKHKPYIAPLPLFLICNLMFFLLQPLLGWNTLTTDLESHLHQQPYSDWVRPLVEHRLAVTQTSTEVFAEKFNHYVSVEARALTLMLVPLFFVPTVLAMVWRRRRSVDHFIFSLHFCAWYLVYLIAIFALSDLGILVVGRPYYRAHWEEADQIVSAVTRVGAAAYLFLAARRVYGESWPTTLAKATLLAFAIRYVVWAYRLFLFFVAFLRS